MSDITHLKIISPAATIVDTHVISVQIPGLEGDFGVLPGHAPFFSMIRPGVIDVQLADGMHRKFFAAAGYADVTATECTLICEHVQDLADVSTIEATEALEVARQALTRASSDAEKTKAQSLLAIAEALVEATGRRAQA